MTDNTCSSVACFLERNNKLVTFPAVTAAGLIDGINPCAIGLLVFLLSYLLVFANFSRKKTVFYGLAYIATVYFTYLFLGIFFFETLKKINLTSFRFFFNKFIGLILLLAGLINLKEGLFGEKQNSKKEKKRRMAGFLSKYQDKINLPVTVAFGFLVTLLETPCSLPLYAGTANFLAKQGLPFLIVAFYFLYYNFLFILPLLVILFLFIKGKNLYEFSEWREEKIKWMKLGLGGALVLFGFWLIRQI